MQIKKATFSCSSPSIKLCPNDDKPEYAFIGRSNVGKSSLINSLVNIKGLAKTSGKPGKTKLINHFLINDNWYIVDLPGYGYAKASKKNRKEFEIMIYDYLKLRKSLLCLFVLIDCRHKPQRNDLNFMSYLGKNKIPFSIIFTKIDKISKSLLKKNITNYKIEMLKTWDYLPELFYSSAVKKIGNSKILTFIEEINNT